MATQLPPVGIRAVIENYNPFAKGIDQLNKKIGEFQKSTQDASKNASPLSKLFDKLGLSVDGLREKFLSMGGVSGNLGAALSEITGALGPMGIALAAVTAAVGAFIALGFRGAALRGIADGFDNLTAAVGILSTTLLTDLRRAAAGTISDFQLMQTANQALLGATGEFAKQFGQALPRLLEIARASARNTGQDVNYLYDSIVLGIKRASPRILDNLGIIINEAEAYRIYAASIGKSVEALTDQEKAIAVLNATLLSGQIAIDAAAQSQETAAEKIARAQATITNIFDKLALAVQPAFEGILDVVNRVLAVIDQLVTAVLPIFQAAVSNLVQPFVTAGNAVMDFVEPIANLAANILPYLIAVAQVIQGVFDGIISFLGSIIQPIIQPILDAFGQIGAFVSNPENVRQLFQGGARMIGALANGILQAANQFVFPAIIQIATFIADFLIGLSPPPKGPLSKIDQGGANTMLAWLQGFTGVSLDPVVDVAREVTAALGDIGKLGLSAVESRLALLDRALLPFSNRLEIVKSQFEAIQEPAEAALRAIDRQMNIAIEALMRGETGAAETVRALDAQRAAIEGAVDAQQQLVDKAQLQFSLAKAQQAQERTLLEIRKKMLGTPTAITKAGQKKAVGGKVPVGEKPKAGAAAPPIAAGGAAIVPPAGETPSVLDLIGGQGAVDEAMAALQQGFAEGLDPATIGEFQANSAALQTQIGRIGGALNEFDLGDRIMTGITAAFDPVQNFFTGEGDGTLSGMIDAGIQFFRDLPTRISAELSRFGNEFGISFVNPLNSFFNGGGGLSGLITSLPTILSGGVAEFAALPLRLVEALGELIPALFTNEDAPFRGLANFFTLQTEDATSLSGMLMMGAHLFTSWPSLIADAVGNLWETLSTGVGPFAGLVNFFNGTGDGSLSWLIDQAVAFFEGFPGRVITALTTFGAAISSALVAPIVTGVNAIIGFIEGLVRTIAGGIADLLQPIFDGIDQLAQSIPALGLPSLSQGSLLQGLRDIQHGFSVPRVTLPGAARGGLFGPGFMRVGERGSEIMGAAQRTAVFPNNFITALNSLTGVMQQVVAQPAPQYAGGGNTAYDQSMTVNQYGVQGSRDSARRFRVMKAMR